MKTVNGMSSPASTLLHISTSVTIQSNEYDFRFIMMDDTRKQMWMHYYHNNPDKVFHYYHKLNDGKKRALESIRKSAEDTSNGLRRFFEIEEKGNKMAPVGFQSKHVGIVSAIACIVKKGSSLETNQELHDNVLMSVGVFTTKMSMFYVMIGICVGFGSDPQFKMDHMSKILASYVASIMDDKNIMEKCCGEKKYSFITRPLETMSKIFVDEKEKDEINLPMIDETRIHDLDLSELRYNKALEWMSRCDNIVSCDANDFACHEQKCIGDKKFFVQFVSHAFSPKWAYTGKRTKNLKKVWEELQNTTRGLKCKIRFKYQNKTYERTICSSSRGRAYVKIEKKTHPISTMFSR